MVNHDASNGRNKPVNVPSDIGYFRMRALSVTHVDGGRKREDKKIP
jgi:hypothetical protein